MAQLVVVAYDGESTAESARAHLFQLQQQALIGLDDAVVVERRANGKVNLKQSRSLVGASSLSGAFWGFLIGLIFLSPALGAAIGAASGAISGRMIDLGIDDNFIKQLGSTIAPGSSALFLLIHSATPDRVISEMKQFGGTILQTNLSEEDETALREAFAEA